uniref:Cocaine- and amphetamine-regulated transcript protein n=1 Tax=Oncorhynchus mykiss TaxID=8022 RepID=A0A8K9XA48_ONCMY|nr:cocaine- and amphetamine-regulated transcript protein-like isoform X2 [Oncorhynchus nerka]
MAKSAAILLVFISFLYILSQSAHVVAGWTDERLPKAEVIEDSRELLGVLHNVLEKLQNRRMAVWERRQSHLPSCIVGDYCTVKKGPRYGQLCDCPRGSKCNLFFLKCL